MDHERLVEILRGSSAVDPVALNAAALEKERWGNDVVRSLLDKRGVSETDLVPLLAEFWGVPGVDLANFRPAMSLIKSLTSEIADAHRAIPLRIEGAFLDVAFEAPLLSAIDALRVHTKLNVRPYVASPNCIERLLEQCYGRIHVGGYQIDPRVTSGNFLGSDVLDLAEGELEIGEASMSIPVDMSGFDEAEVAKAGTGEGDLADVGQSLQRAEQRIKLLEAHVARDQDVLRRLFGYLIDKGVGTREEIVKLLS